MVLRHAGNERVIVVEQSKQRREMMRRVHMECVDEHGMGGSRHLGAWQHPGSEGSGRCLRMRWCRATTRAAVEVVRAEGEVVSLETSLKNLCSMV